MTTIDDAGVSCPHCAATHAALKGFADVMSTHLKPREDPERFTLEGNAVADASGNARVSFRVFNGQRWFVERVGVNGNSTATPVCVLLLATTDNPPDNSGFRDGTPNGNLDAMDANHAIWCRAGEYLVVKWSGATPGAQFFTSVQYRLVRRGN